MKKTILTLSIGMITGFLLFPLASDLSQLDGKWRDFFVLPGYGSTEAFVGHCTKDISRNGHGWVFINREFFECGKVSVFISDLLYGEYRRGLPPTEKDLKDLEDFNATREKAE